MWFSGLDFVWECIDVLDTSHHYHITKKGITKVGLKNKKMFLCTTYFYKRLKGFNWAWSFSLSYCDFCISTETIKEEIEDAVYFPQTQTSQTRSKVWMSWNFHFVKVVFVICICLCYRIIFYICIPPLDLLYTQVYQGLSEVVFHLGKYDHH